MKLPWYHVQKSFYSYNSLIPNIKESQISNKGPLHLKISGLHTSQWTRRV